MVEPAAFETNIEGHLEITPDREPGAFSREPKFIAFTWGMALFATSASTNSASLMPFHLIRNLILLFESVATPTIFSALKPGVEPSPFSTAELPDAQEIS